jgi:hypothetical protein
MSEQHEVVGQFHEQGGAMHDVVTSVDAPAQPPDVRDLPHGLTIFLTGRQRAQVLRKLRRIDGNRTVALLTALGLMETA